MNFRQAADSIDANFLNLSKRVHSGAIAIADVLAYELPKNTPVDTGEARSNWRIVGGATKPVVPSNVIGPYFPGINLGIAEVANLGRAVAQAKIDLLASTLSLPPFSDMHIVVFNNTPYIGDLNNGYSPQAPAGFVDAAILKAIASVSF